MGLQNLSNAIMWIWTISGTVKIAVKTKIKPSIILAVIKVLNNDYEKRNRIRSVFALTNKRKIE